ARRAMDRAAGPARSSRIRSSSPELLDEPSEHGFDLALDVPLRSSGIDALDPRRVAARKVQISGPDSLEERALLALEMIVLARGDAGAADLDGRIEQQRKIRLETALDAGAQALGKAEVDAPAGALISERRIGEPVAHHPCAPIECGHNGP